MDEWLCVLVCGLERYFDMWMRVCVGEWRRDMWTGDGEMDEWKVR